MPAPAQTGDLDLHRWIGAEARAFALLQRISNEVSELIDIGRFLSRLKEIIETEFPDSMVDIFIRDSEHDQLFAISDGTGRNRARRRLYLEAGQRHRWLGRAERKIAEHPRRA